MVIRVLFYLLIISAQVTSYLELPGLKLLLELAARQGELLGMGSKLSGLEGTKGKVSLPVCHSVPHLLESHHVLLCLLCLSSLRHGHREVVKSRLHNRMDRGEES